MNAVKVEYTVQESYVETNKQNIARVMDALQAMDDLPIRYAVFLKEDGKTFVHFAIRKDESAGSVLSDLPEFQSFQQQLRASNPEVPPQPENLTPVGVGWNPF